MVRESLAVLAAILVAFALDAWWEERTERRDAMIALEAVRTELERNQIEFERVITADEDVMTVFPRMLGLDEDAVAAMSPGELEEFDFGGFQIMQPEAGALQSFLVGGHLRAIRDQSLRTALSGHSQSWDEVTEDGVIAGGKWSTAADVWIGVNGAQLTAAVFAGDPTALRRATIQSSRSDDFMEAMLSASVFTQIYLDEMMVLGEELDALETLIEGELGR